MELTEKEQELIYTIRKAKASSKYEEVVMLFRYVPVNENEYIQQCTQGKSTSILSIRGQMKKLLDDLIQINQASSSFSIVYEPGLLQIFKH